MLRDRNIIKFTSFVAERLRFAPNSSFSEKNNIISTQQNWNNHLHSSHNITFNFPKLFALQSLLLALLKIENQTSTSLAVCCCWPSGFVYIDTPHRRGDHQHPKKVLCLIRAVQYAIEWKRHGLHYGQLKSGVLTGQLSSKPKTDNTRCHICLQTREFFQQHTKLIIHTLSNILGQFGSIVRFSHCKPICGRVSMKRRLIETCSHGPTTVSQTSTSSGYPKTIHWFSSAESLFN